MAFRPDTDHSRFWEVPVEPIRDASTMSSIGVCVKHMEERGFLLPEDLPDSTFKRPEWMDGNQ